ncbi:UNVERIFIED_CONTAM: hypothetical protein GTU68_019475 [Idotea baltica]|nr:hypothetical protein [Idotea baltica]
MPPPEASMLSRSSETTV